MNQDKAIQNLKNLKAHYPFRQWFAIEIKGEWYFKDAKKKIVYLMKKHGINEAQILDVK